MAGMCRLPLRRGSGGVEIFASQAAALRIFGW